MDSVSMCTGAILSRRNFIISRNGLVGCLGLPNFFVISRCKSHFKDVNWQFGHQNKAVSFCLSVLTTHPSACLHEHVGLTSISNWCLILSSSSNTWVNFFMKSCALPGSGKFPLRKQSKVCSMELSILIIKIIIIKNLVHWKIAYTMAGICW